MLGNSGFPSSSSFSNAARGGWAELLPGDRLFTWRQIDAWNYKHQPHPTSPPPPPHYYWYTYAERLPRPQTRVLIATQIWFSSEMVLSCSHSICLISDYQAQNLSLYCGDGGAESRTADCTVGDTICNDTCYEAWRIWDEDSTAYVVTQDSYEMSLI